MSDPKTDPSSLGNILLALGYCSQDDIDLALSRKGKNGTAQLLGQILIELNIITKDQLNLALAHQHIDRDEEPVEVKLYVTEQSKELYRELAETAKSVQLLAAKIMKNNRHL